MGLESHVSDLSCSLVIANGRILKPAFPQRKGPVPVFVEPSLAILENISPEGRFPGKVGTPAELGMWLGPWGLLGRLVSAP